MMPVDALHDYWCYFDRFQLLHTTAFFHSGDRFAYHAPGVLLYKFLYSFGLRGGFAIYLLIVSVAISAASVAVRKAILKRGFRAESADGFLLLLLLTSYPIAFCLQRGNIEFLIAIGLALGTWAYWKNHTFPAAILWGVFGTIKLYPLIILAIFLSRRQYRQLAIGVFSGVAAMVLAIWYIGPDFRTAALGTASGMGAFVNAYSLKFDYWIGFDHSLFALLKLTLAPFGIPIAHQFSGYLIVVSAIMLPLYFLRIRKLPVANQLMILSICAILLPPVSGDYTLLQLYAPFMILVFLVLDHKASGLTPAFLLLAFLFTPTNFFFLAGHSYSAQIKCFLLLSLLIVMMARPIPGRLRLQGC